MLLVAAGLWLLAGQLPLIGPGDGTCSDEPWENRLGQTFGGAPCPQDLDAARERDEYFDFLRRTELRAEEEREQQLDRAAYLDWWADQQARKARDETLEGIVVPEVVAAEPWPEETAAPPSPAVSSFPRFRVGNTDGEGVYLRRAPSMAASERLVAWPDGTPMENLGQPIEITGEWWERVRDPEGREGFIKRQYLLTERAPPPTTAVTIAGPPGRVAPGDTASVSASGAPRVLEGGAAVGRGAAAEATGAGRGSALTVG